LSPQGASKLGAALASLSAFEHLDVSDNSKWSTDTLATLAERLAGPSTFRKLVAQSAHLGSGAGPVRFGIALVRLRALQHLDLSEWKHLGTAQVVAFATHIGVLPALTALHLKRCKLLYSGAAALAQSLLSLRTLRSLDLTDCCALDPGVAALARALSCGTTGLTTLRLRDNRCKRDGGLALCSALPVLTGLQALELDGCDMLSAFDRGYGLRS
jgi:Ran GTPase-activating protein (RanGAP) involved in mRNA processing and transport